MTTFVATAGILVCKRGIDIAAAEINNINLCENYHEAYSVEKQACVKTWKSPTSDCQKIKENMKELDQLFANHYCVHIKWEVPELLLLFFNCGSVANIALDERKTSIEKIFIDNSLCGKLASENLTDVIFNDSCMFISYFEPKLTYIRFTKQSSFSNKLLGNKKSKLTGFEPNITTVDLIVPSSQRLEKKLSINNLNDCILIWWHYTSTDVWPWMPVNHNTDHLLVYTLNGSSVEIMCSAEIEGELLHANFSKWHSNRISTLEEIVKGGKCSINICTYEVTYGGCHCTSISKLPLQSRMASFAWNFLEDKLLVADEATSLLVYDVKNNTTLITVTSFVAENIIWHPSGVLAAVIGPNGMVQCYDAALSVIQFQSLNKSSEPLNSISFHSIVHPLKTGKVIWQNNPDRCRILSASEMCSDTSDTLLIYFATGIFTFLKFYFGCITRKNLTPIELISQYLKCDNVVEAVCLLQSLDWCQQSELCFQCVSIICNHLLRKPLCLQTESALEHSLGSFYNSLHALPETVVYSYHQQVNSIARRFFHRLLRFCKFEKAYLLAVELQSRDLFLDLHRVARMRNESGLAVSAYQHAEQLQGSSDNSDEQTDSDIDTSDVSSTDELEENHYFSGHQFISSNIFSSENHSVSEVQNPVESVKFCKAGNWDIFMSHNTQFKISPEVRTPVTYDHGKLFNNNLGHVESDIDNSNAKKSEVISSHGKIIIPGSPDIVKPVRRLQLSSSSDELECTKNLNSNPYFQFINRNSLVSQEILEDEEEHVEGVTVKFSHFGVV